MPFVAILIGALMIDLALRGTEHEFAAVAATDFGKGSKFWSWAAAIAAIGALGYVDSLKRVSTLFLALVLLVLTLKNGGLFSQLAAVIANPPTAAPGIPISSYGGGSSSNQSGGSGGGSGGSSSSSSSSSSSEPSDTQKAVQAFGTAVQVAALLA